MKPVLLAALLSAALASPAFAGEKFALIVTASAYPEQKGVAIALEGPRNDAKLLYRTLRDGGMAAERIRVYADTIDRSAYPDPLPTAGDPTLANIRAGIRWLVSTASRGDEVMIFLAGHGSFHPETSVGRPAGRSDEDDGTDEIFLPIDIGTWNEKQQVTNELIDNEIGADVDRLLAKGVFVWLVVDACHSGTASRAAGDGGVDRAVSPALLGVPASIAAGRTRGGSAGPTRPLVAPPPDAETGRFVAFYATMPDQRAKENRVPFNAPEKEQRQHGLMTYALVQAMRLGQSATYAGLAAQIIAAYDEWRLPVQPLFEGNLNATPIVFAGRDRAWRVSASTGTPEILAGDVDNIGPGAVFAVQQVGAGPDSPPLFYAQITQTRLDRSAFEPISNDPARPIDKQRLESLGLSLTDYRTFRSLDRVEARLVERVPALTLRVAAPVAAPAAVTALAQAAEPPVPVALAWVAGNANPDVRLEVAENRLWFVPGAQALITTGPRQNYSLALAGLTPETVAGALRGIAKANNLLRMAARYRMTDVARSLSTTVAIGSGRREPGGRCQMASVEPRMPADARPVPAAQLTAGQPIKINICDRVYVAITNNGRSIIDLTPLYVDPWERTVFLNGYERATYSGLRLAPGETRLVSWTELPEEGGPTIAGPGKLLLLAVEADPKQSVPVDFRYLEERLSGDRRDIGTRGFGAALHAVAFGGPGQRSAPEVVDGGGIVTVNFESLPAAGQ